MAVVLERGGYALNIVLNGSKNLLDIALIQLTHGQTHYQQGHFPQAADWLDQAVASLREAGVG